MKRWIKATALILLSALMLTSAVGTARADGTEADTAATLKKDGRSIGSASELSLYDVVTFGKYTQTALGSELPIEWYVTKIEGDRVRLLSRYCLDSRQFHSSSRKMTFEQSDLYAWLNEEFKNRAFSAEEQQMLCNGVTLPDEEEAMELPIAYRAATGTEYAIKACGYKAASNNWWLSDPTVMNYQWLDDHDRTYPRPCAKTINYYGKDVVIFPLNYHGKGVRPMIVIDLNGGGSGTGTDTGGAVLKNGQSVGSAMELSLYDVVTFGTYPKDALGTVMPIEWYVIRNDGNRVQLLSRYCLDSQTFHSSSTKMNFESSDLYAWLNGTFKNKAFTAEEQQMLLNNITLPKAEEAMALPIAYRAATGTEYAIKVCGFRSASNNWWLSDPTVLSYQWWNDKDSTWPRPCAKTINYDGSDIQVFPLNYHGKGVRPMIVIDLNGNSSGTGTGTGTGSGTGTSQPIPKTFLFGGVLVNAGDTYVKVVGKKEALIRITPEEMDLLIRACPNLTTLTLNYCCMADYSRIGELTKLKNLMIATTTHEKDPGIPLVDIDWMASLRDLRTLYLPYNKISDIRVLSKLTKLEELNLGWNAISDSDLNDLTGLPLRILYLYNNSSLRDVSALSKISSLELLHIGGNKKLKFSGIKRLTSLSRLKELDISYCPVEDFVWVQDFKRLQTLRIEYSDYIDFYTYYDLAASDTLQTVVISKKDTKTEEALRAMIRDCKSDIEIVYWENYKN